MRLTVQTGATCDCDATHQFSIEFFRVKHVRISGETADRESLWEGQRDLSRKIVLVIILPISAYARGNNSVYRSVLLEFRFLIPRTTEHFEIEPDEFREVWLIVFVEPIGVDEPRQVIVWCGKYGEEKRFAVVE